MVIKVSKHTTEPPCSTISPDKWGRGLTKRQFTVLRIFIFGSAYTEGSTDYILFLKVPRSQKKKKEGIKEKNKR